MNFTDLIDDVFHDLDYVLSIDIVSYVRLYHTHFKNEDITIKLTLIDQISIARVKLNTSNKHFNSIKNRLRKINPMYIDINLFNIIDDGINMITSIKQQCATMLTKLTDNSVTIEDIDNYYNRFSEKIYDLNKLRTELVEDGEAFCDDDEAAN